MEREPVSMEEIIVVGKEVLTGRTLDTNSNCLAKRIAALGGDVKRVVGFQEKLARLSMATI